MAAVKSGYVEVDGGKLYYEEAGKGETLVLCHAGFVDGGMWDDQWDVFAKHYHVVRYDMRGFGKSDVVTGPVSRYEELVHFLKAIKVERAILLGCSMGGASVIDVAVGHPELVSALIAVSAVPSGFEMQGPPPPALMKMMEVAQKGDDEATSELQIQIWIDGESRKPGEVDAKVRKHAAKMNQIAVKNKTFGVADSQPVNPLTPPAFGRLSELHIPVLIIDGSLDNAEILRAGDVMRASIPGAQKVVIEGTAHMPNMEKPEEFNKTVLDFLKEAQRS